MPEIPVGAIKSTKIGTNEVTVVDECRGVGSMQDWADDKAREWLAGGNRVRHPDIRVELAALLREVAKQGVLVAVAETEKSVLAEVRRVVEETVSDVTLACITEEERDAIKALRGALISRLEKLT